MEPLLSLAQKKFETNRKNKSHLYLIRRVKDRLASQSNTLVRVAMDVTRELTKGGELCVIVIR
jgi:hypothetical protein